jgi:hypothetical protein
MEDRLDTEYIALMAQIATGIATLAVAIFLANQLRLQHDDSVRQLSSTMSSNLLNMTVTTMIADSEFADIYLRGCEDYSQLNKTETHRFNMYMVAYFNQTQSLWRHESVKADPKRNIYNMLQTGPGVVKWWNNVGLNLLSPEFIDYVHEELFENEKLRQNI